METNIFVVIPSSYYVQTPAIKYTVKLLHGHQPGSGSVPVLVECGSGQMIQIRNTALNLESSYSRTLSSDSQYKCKNRSMCELKRKKHTSN